MDPRSYSASDKTRDGTFVRVRAIRPDDRERLVESFTLLSTETIRARWGGENFGPTAGEIVGEIATGVALDPDVHLGLVATVWIDGSERIVGLASYFVDAWSEPLRAEVAFTVLDEWQGRGIGSLLFRHLARLARQCGMNDFYAFVVASNSRMLRIFEKSGLPLEVEYEGAEAWVHLDLVGSGITRRPARAAIL
jgi:GNAT superfamily N-acetyltransferase